MKAEEERLGVHITISLEEEPLGTGMVSPLTKCIRYPIFLIRFALECSSVKVLYFVDVVVGIGIGQRPH